MADNLTTCVTCGKQYKVCKHCKGYVSWRATACTPRCFQVSQTINEYFYKKISAMQAKDQLACIGCDQIEHLTPNTEKWVAKISADARKEQIAMRRYAKNAEPSAPDEESEQDSSQS